MEELRILIADDHPLFRHGIQSLLNANTGFEVVGEATTGEEAIRLAEHWQPDVIVMDIQMPSVNGIEATRRILRTSPNIRILIVTMFEDDASVFTAIRAGARGYVLKDSDNEDILVAIRAVGRGEAIFSPAIASRLIDFFSTLHTPSSSQSFPELTVREREILDLIAQGKSNNEIAAQLVLSPGTVRNYVSNVFSKLQVADRAEAMLKARDAGLG